MDGSFSEEVMKEMREEITTLRSDLSELKGNFSSFKEKQEEAQEKDVERWENLNHAMEVINDLRGFGRVVVKIGKVVKWFIGIAVGVLTLIGLIHYTKP